MACPSTMHCCASIEINGCASCSPGATGDCPG
jgi:hypothetical protein